MTNGIKYLLFLSMTLCLMCCKTKHAQEKEQKHKVIFVFGQYNISCPGGNCVQIYQLKDQQVFEDVSYKTISTTAFFIGNFSPMEGHNVGAIEELVEQFPAELFTEENIEIGCPNCDGRGGIYLEIEKEGLHRFWLIDNNCENLPKYLRNYIKTLKSKLTQLNT